MSRRVDGSWAVLGLLLGAGRPVLRRSRSRSRAPWLLLLGCGALWSLGCGSDDADSPTTTLSRFLETMDRSNLYESARKEAYAMLDETAQEALAERARRAALVSGREFSPWDMLAPDRFRLRFAPAERGGMRATVTGEHAVVHVVSEDGKDKVNVPMTRQAGRWRVQLAVPAVRREPRTSVPRATDPTSGLLGLREQAPAATRGDGPAGLPSLAKPAQKP